MLVVKNAFFASWKDLEKLWPLIEDGQSDTACFDNCLELLVAGGYSLPHAMMMLIPEPWAGNSLMSEKKGILSIQLLFNGTMGWPCSCCFY